MRHLLLLLLGVLLFCTTGVTRAQERETVRPDYAFYLRGMLGTTAYGGERDLDSDGNLGGVFSEFGFPGLGFEVGYRTQTIAPFGVGVGLTYYGGEYDQISQNVAPYPAFDPESSEWRHTLGLVGHLGFLPASRWNPYVRGGLGLTFGEVTLAGEDSETRTAFSPIIGVGIDYALSSRFGLFIEATEIFTTPDDEIDAADDSGFDMLGVYGGGIRFNFIRSTPTPVRIVALDAPEQLQVGESGTFTASVNPDAEEPIRYQWEFGTGAMATGLTAAHTYAEPGEYTVTFTASNEAGTVSESTTVEVVPPPVPAEVVSMEATPRPATEGEPVQFSANVRGDEPIEYRWQFGDGDVSEAPSPTHVYDEPGTYEVQLSVANDAGEATQTLQLIVEPALAAICTEITEFNAAFFERNASMLTEEARSALQDNLEILSQCPNLGVRIEGYASPFERNVQALSEDRTQAVAQFYEEGGIAPGRLTVQAMGAVEGVTSKKGGTSQLRRVESIPIPQEAATE